jgi:hypothetical protein
MYFSSCLGSNLRCVHERGGRAKNNLYLNSGCAELHQWTSNVYTAFATFRIRDILDILVRIMNTGF